MQNKNKDRENKCMDIKGEGWGGINWEISADIYTPLTLYITQITNEKLLYSARNLILCSVVN